MTMHDRTEIIETPAGREVTEVTTARPAAAVDRSEAVAYDPYARRRQTAYRLNQAIWLLFGFIEALLAIRFVLKLLGANPNAGFADFMYGITAPLVAPFVGLFGNPAANGAVLELHTLIAMVVYALIGWVIARAAWIMVGENRSAVSTHATSVDTRS
jgi:hypothetical protein